ncbi:MAG: hypothetical protein LW819_11600 [Fimbriimonadaceae bacterium]|jgi:hypothetical protein|nr:hypothetical protein [Fimbriimonadaceae bacterium]
MSAAGEDRSSGELPVDSTPAVPEQATGPDEQAEGGSFPPEIMASLPPEARAFIEMSLMQIGPMPNPLYKQVNSGHIDKLLDNAAKDAANEASAHREEVVDRKHNRITTWVGVILAILVLGIIWAVVPDQKLGSLSAIVEKIFLVVAGALGGYGIGKLKIQDDS